MFGTPLFYPERMIPDRFEFLAALNPMAYLVRMFREVCLKNAFPDMNDILIFAVISIGFLLIGYFVYTKRFYQFVDQL
jgi:ABC-type polysaccharide/polyol phosphate export permease